MFDWAGHRLSVLFLVPSSWPSRRAKVPTTFWIDSFLLSTLPSCSWMLAVTCSAPLWARSGNIPTPSWRRCLLVSPNYAQTHRDAASLTAMVPTLEPSWSSWDQSNCPPRTSKRFQSCSLMYNTEPETATVHLTLESLMEVLSLFPEWDCVCVCFCRFTERRCITTSNHWSNVWRKLLSCSESWWEGSSSCPESLTTKKTSRWVKATQKQTTSRNRLNIQSSLRTCCSAWNYPALLINPVKLVLTGLFSSSTQSNWIHRVHHWCNCCPLRHFFLNHNSYIKSVAVDESRCWFVSPEPRPSPPATPPSWSVYCGQRKI